MTNFKKPVDTCHLDNYTDVDDVEDSIHWLFWNPKEHGARDSESFNIFERLGWTKVDVAGAHDINAFKGFERLGAEEIENRVRR